MYSKALFNGKKRFTGTAALTIDGDFDTATGLTLRGLHNDTVTWTCGPLKISPDPSCETSGPEVMNFALFEWTEADLIAIAGGDHAYMIHSATGAELLSVSLGSTGKTSLDFAEVALAPRRDGLMVATSKRAVLMDAGPAIVATYRPEHLYARAPLIEGDSIVFTEFNFHTPLDGEIKNAVSLQ